MPLPRNASLAGRIDEAIRYATMGEAALERGSYAAIPFGFEASLGTVYHLAGEPEKTAVNGAQRDCA